MPRRSRRSANNGYYSMPVTPSTPVMDYKMDSSKKPRDSPSTNQMLQTILTEMQKKLNSKTKVNVSTKRRRKGFVQQAITGSYTGKFKMRSKKTKLQKKKFREVLLKKYENRGSVTDPDCVYLGVGPPLLELWTSVCRAIVFELFRQKGDIIESWAEGFADIRTASNPLKIRYQWFEYAGDTAGGEVIFSVTAGSTFGAVATQLATSITTNWSSNGTHFFRQIAMFYDTSNSTEQTQQIVAKIDPAKFILKISEFDNLMVQNQTLAGLAASPDGDDDKTNAVTVNPLYCFTFQRSGNTFYPKWRAYSDASYQGFTADYSTGVIKTTAADSLPEIGKEPGNIFVGVRKYGKAILAPGAIKRLSNNYSRSLSLNAYVKIFMPFIRDNDYDQAVSFGSSSLIAAEKQLQSVAGENPIILAYEINRTMKIAYSYSTWSKPVQEVSVN